MASTSELSSARTGTLGATGEEGAVLGVEDWPLLGILVADLAALSEGSSSRLAGGLLAVRAVTARLAVTVVLATCARDSLGLLAGAGAVSLLGVSLGLLTLFERVTAATGVTGALLLGEERLTLAGLVLTALVLALLATDADGFLSPLTLGARDGVVVTGLVSRGLVVGAAD